jgi:DNA primase
VAARYTHDSKERVRDAVDMVDLVGTRTELRRAGANRYEGLCPFHDERTPSFGIDPAQKLFYCFGCGEGGDAFRFVQLTEGLDFKGAMEHIADRYGVRLEVVEEDPAAAERRRARERLHELLERTAAFYVRYLWDSAEAAPARAYLAGRGLEEAALREFRVGYAPSAHDTLLHAIRRAGFSNREAYDAGLAQRARGQGVLYDRFRRRIMFPLCDLRGRVLGFGARALGADQRPKYLNSSDNAVYHKGRHLFGADIARAHATRAGSVIVAEGYTDVIAMHQAGLRNTVGLMGTALTEEQVGELARLAPRVQLALDADGAGQEAMLRAARVAAGRRLELRVVPLPAGTDPADLVQAEGAQAMGRLVEASVPFVRFRVERELDTGDLSSADGKERVIQALAPLFADLGEAVRDDLLKLVADRTNLKPDLLASLLFALRRREQGPTRPSRATLDPVTEAELDFLAKCLAVPSQGTAALRALESGVGFSGELSRRAALHLRDRLEEPTIGLQADDTELAQLVAELAARAARTSRSVAALEGATLNLELLHLDRQITAARRAGLGVAPLAARRSELQQRRDEAIEREMVETQPAE